MRIALATDWFAPRRGGIERQLGELSERLVERGHDVRVLTSTTGAVDDANRVRRLDTVTLPWLDVALSPALPGVLRHELSRGFDLVHAHVSVVSPVGYAAAVLARAMGLPTVVTFHSVLRGKVPLLRATNAVADFARGPITWTAVSEGVASQVRRALKGADVGVLSNGIDLRFWQDARHGDTRSVTDVVTLVTTMRLHRKKRPLQLVRAFALAVARAQGAARLLIVGDGPERRAIEREIQELGLAAPRASIELLGWREPDVLRGVYGNADGFVLASERESFGIAALEARAAGLPVIAMAASGSSEFLRDGTDALLCADDGELIASIARFISDRALRRALAANTPTLTRYEWNTVLEEHERAYGRAVRRARDAEAAARARA